MEKAKTATRYSAEALEPAASTLYGVMDVKRLYDM